MGDVVVWFMFHLLRMSSYCCPIYRGPLSVINFSGGPKMLNHCADLCAIAVLVVECTLSTR